MGSKSRVDFSAGMVGRNRIPARAAETGDDVGEGRGVDETLALNQRRRQRGVETVARAIAVHYVSPSIT